MFWCLIRDLHYGPWPVTAEFAGVSAQQNTNTWSTSTLQWSQRNSAKPGSYVMKTRLFVWTMQIVTSHKPFHHAPTRLPIYQFVWVPRAIPGNTVPISASKRTDSCLELTCGIVISNWAKRTRYLTLVNRNFYVSFASLYTGCTK